MIWAIVKVNAKDSWPANGRTARFAMYLSRLCHQAGGELEQIQFLLGHVSIQTRERYLGCQNRFRNAVNDHIGLEPDAPLLNAALACEDSTLPLS